MTPPTPPPPKKFALTSSSHPPRPQIYTPSHGTHTQTYPRASSRSQGPFLPTSLHPLLSSLLPSRLSDEARTTWIVSPTERGYSSELISSIMPVCESADVQPMRPTRSYFSWFRVVMVKVSSKSWASVEDAILGGGVTEFCGLELLRRLGERWRLEGFGACPGKRVARM